MSIFYIGIGALIVLALFAAITTLFTKKKECEPDVVMPSSGDCSSCDGTDDKCEQVCMMEAATREIEYYDDEELDRFRGRQSNQYTDEEAEEFANILYTMQPQEAKGWNRSLILREINVPNQIKDELITMIEG
jgi:K+/H+ antiporter YhaU regulatory subunit KhtT